MNRALASTIRFVLLMGALAVAGGLGVPVAGYLIGKRVIGPYEGKLGLTDYADSIYAGAAQGDILAWMILASPLLITVVWYVILRLEHRLVRHSG